MVKKSPFLCAITLFVFILALAGCTSYLYNPDVTYPQKHKITDVRAAIMEACPRTGWQPREIGNNTIEATLAKHNRTTVITIPYSEYGYKILFKSSESKDKESGKISTRRYNNWMINLQNNINAYLASKSAL